MGSGKMPGIRQEAIGKGVRVHNEECEGQGMEMKTRTVHPQMEVGIDERLNICWSMTSFQFYFTLLE